MSGRMDSTQVPAIHRLSPELLQIVFHLAVNAAGHEGAPAHTYLTHVCRRWRKIATETQDFWSRWPRYRSREAWTTLCCLRATTTALSLDWRFGWGFTPSTAQTQSGYLARIRPTLPHASRARDLTIRVESYPNVTQCDFWGDEVLPALTLQAFPLLQYLSIAMFEGSHRARDCFFCLTDTLFSGISPSDLRQVHLNACRVTLHCPIFSANLRHLELTDSHTWSNLSDMIHVFQSIPNLETFAYNLTYSLNELNTFNVTKGSEVYALRSVPMNRLKSFKLDEVLVVHGMTIFSYLALPFDAEIFVHWNEDEVEHSNDSELSPQKRTQCVEHMRLFATALRLHYEPALLANRYFRSVDIEHTVMWAYPNLPGTSPDDGSLPSLALYPPLMNSELLFAETEPCEMTALQPIFHQATYLRLAGHTSEWAVLWRHIHLYQKVTELELVEDNVITFVQRLSSTEHQSLPPLFPALEVIVVKEFDFVEAAGRGPGEHGHLSIEALGNAVDRAYGSSKCFEALYIDHSCNDYLDIVARLQSQMRLTVGSQGVVEGGQYGN